MCPPKGGSKEKTSPLLIKIAAGAFTGKVCSRFAVGLVLWCFMRLYYVVPYLVPQLSTAFCFLCWTVSFFGKRSLFNSPGAIGSLLANPFDLLKVRMQGGDINQARMSETLLNNLNISEQIKQRCLILSALNIFELTRWSQLPKLYTGKLVLLDCGVGLARQCSAQLCWQHPRPNLWAVSNISWFCVVLLNSNSE